MPPTLLLAPWHHLHHCHPNASWNLHPWYPHPLHPYHPCHLPDAPTPPAGPLTPPTPLPPQCPLKPYTPWQPWAPMLLSSLHPLHPLLVPWHPLSQNRQVSMTFYQPVGQAAVLSHVHHVLLSSVFSWPSSCQPCNYNTTCLNIPDISVHHMCNRNG